MVTTDDPAIWRRVWEFKDHGKSWDAVYNKNHPVGFRWLHESIGTNGRMTEMQATIGRIQLRKLPAWNARRADNARRLASRLSRLISLGVPMPADDVVHAWYKFHVFLRPEHLKGGWTRDRIVAAISAEGIPAYSGFCPEIYLEKAFESSKLMLSRRLSMAKLLGETSLMFLIHPTLTEEEIDDTATAIEKVMSLAAKAETSSPA